MKFARIILLTILSIISYIVSKKKSRQPSQGTRNYRHHHLDPSYNPLPRSWHTAPRSNFAQYSGKKYQEQISKMAHSLLFKLLEFSYNKRFTPEKALNHPWITRDRYQNIPETYFEGWRIISIKRKFKQVNINLFILLNFSNSVFCSNYIC